MDWTAELQARLEAGGLRLASVEHYDELGSTNDYLKEAARSGALEWSVVHADRQTAGRGRQGREWLSSEGDLCFSVLLRPAGPPETAALLPLASGLAVADALEGFGVEARLKWPNDVLVADKKIAGILAEGVSTGGTLDAIVVGIGANLALDPARLPAELAGRVTSLRAETGQAPATLEAAAAVLARLAVWYHALERDGGAVVLPAWRSRALAWWGQTVEVVSGGETLRGIARDVDARGALLLDTERGPVAVLSGEARSLRIQ